MREVGDKVRDAHWPDEMACTPLEAPYESYLGTSRVLWIEDRLRSLRLPGELASPGSYSKKAGYYPWTQLARWIFRSTRAIKDEQGNSDRVDFTRCMASFG